MDVIHVIRMSIRVKMVSIYSGCYTRYIYVHSGINGKHFIVDAIHVI